MIEPIGVQSTDEIGRVARAFDQVHAEAVRLAGTEAQLRGNLNSMFISLSRRSVPLIERLARMIDDMEQNEDDPDQLAKLFSMDHLVTRMRRNSENLLVLAGEEPVRKWTESVPLDRHHPRRRGRDRAVQPGGARRPAGDHGLRARRGRHRAPARRAHRERHAVLARRARRSASPSWSWAAAECSSRSADDGVGISPPRLADMNWRLDHPPVVDVSISRHMGLYAVSRLAAQARDQGQAPPRHAAGAVRPGLAAWRPRQARAGHRGSAATPRPYGTGAKDPAASIPVGDERPGTGSGGTAAACSPRAAGNRSCPSGRTRTQCRRGAERRRGSPPSVRRRPMRGRGPSGGTRAAQLAVDDARLASRRPAA